MLVDGSVGCELAWSLTTRQKDMNNIKQFQSTAKNDGMVGYLGRKITSLLTSLSHAERYFFLLDLPQKEAHFFSGKKNANKGNHAYGSSERIRMIQVDCFWICR